MPASLRDLYGVLVHVLPVTRPVFEPAEQLDKFGMDAEDADLEHRRFAVFLDLLIEFLSDLFHRFLDAGGMDAAVVDQLFKGEPGDFPADGVKTGENDDLRRIVDDGVRCPWRFQGRGCSCPRGR